MKEWGKSYLQEATKVFEKDQTSDIFEERFAVLTTKERVKIKKAFKDAATAELYATTNDILERKEMIEQFLED